MKDYNCFFLVSKRDIAIARHHLETNHVRKVQRLSNYIWELKENIENHTIDWSIAMKAHPYIHPYTRKCDLCLCEKLLINRAN